MQSLVAKLAAAAVSAVLLVGALVFSLAIFIVVLAAALVFGGYFWWKTRKLRRQMREHAWGEGGFQPGAEAQNNVIEGVVVSRSQVRVEDDRIESVRR